MANLTPLFTRPRHASPRSTIVISVTFGVLFLFVATADLFLAPKLDVNTPLDFTIRLPGIGFYSDTMAGGTSYRHMRKVHPRGTVLTAEDLRVIRAYEDLRRPPRGPVLVGLGLTFVMLLFLLMSFVRIQSAGTLLPRMQISIVTNLLLLAILGKIYLMTTGWSSLWIPLSMVVIPIAIHLGQRTAAMTTLAGSLILGLLTPMDLTLLLVTMAQGMTASLVMRQKNTGSNLIWGTAAAMAGGGTAYVGASLLFQNSILAAAPSILGSELVAAFGGGLLGGLFAIVLTPLMGSVYGVLSRAKLLSLANLESPLLKNLATRAPGTWAHSQTMANMAEMVANAIGADALLVRIGAYHHDLGKATQPEYFIENQTGSNPHDELDPDVSADAIFAHVTEGMKQAVKHKLPTQVTQFIYTHHGNGLLDFFWHKCQAAGNPKQLDEKDFCYPGVPPQSPEAAILSICDAVEAASRTLEEATDTKIKELIRQIVLAKLDRGMLSECNLSLQQLQGIMASLQDILKSSQHGRVKYPWQGKKDPGVQNGDQDDDLENRNRVLTKPMGSRALPDLDPLNPENLHPPSSRDGT